MTLIARHMMFTAPAAALLCTLASLLPARAMAQAAPEPKAPASALPAIAPEALAEYTKHVTFLADPSMEGRGPGSKGNVLAADYIEAHFKALGLDPIFPITDQADARGYRQTFEAGRRATKTRAILAAADGSATLAAVPLGFSGTAAVTAPLVFVGYGIQGAKVPGPEGTSTYNTFVDGADDLSGKIAVLLRFEPMNAQGKSLLRGPNDSGSWSSAASIAAKIEQVTKRKAAGLIIVAPPGADDPRTNRAETTEGTARWSSAASIPVAYMTATQGEALIAWADQTTSLLALRTRADQLTTPAAAPAGPESGVIPLGTKSLTMDIAIDRSLRMTDNVAALLAGVGELKDETIVIGAHYDHVGLGFTGGSRSDDYGVIHPGADDNASGTAGLMLLAEMLKREATQSRGPRRSVLFIAFSAEEMGLIGSRHYIKNPPAELTAAGTTIMINLDMIGRLRNEQLEISGTGTAEGLAELVQEVVSRGGLSPKMSPGGRGPSDHASFYATGVPVLHFFTGLHDEYHTPKDTLATINFEGGLRVTNIVADLTRELATRKAGLTFTSTDRAPPAATNPAPGAGPGGPAMGGLKVRFGIAPGSYAEGEVGIPVGSVYPGTSAAEAGIVEGDRLMAWNGQPITDVAGWMTQMARHVPGDVVDVTLKRKDGAETVVRVTLKSRDQAPR